MKYNYYLLLLIIIISLNSSLIAQELEVTRGGTSIGHAVTSSVEIVGSNGDVIAMWTDDRPFRLEFYSDDMKRVKKIKLPNKYDGRKIFFRNSIQIGGNTYIFYSTKTNKKKSNLKVYAQKVNLETLMINDELILIGDYPIGNKLIDKRIFVRKSKNEEHLLVFYNIIPKFVSRKLFANGPKNLFVYSVFNSNMNLEWKKTRVMRFNKDEGSWSMSIKNTKIRNDGKVFFTNIAYDITDDKYWCFHNIKKLSDSDLEKYLEETKAVFYRNKLTCLSKDIDDVTIEAGINQGTCINVVFDFDDSLNVYIGGVESIQYLCDYKKKSEIDMINVNYDSLFDSDKWGKRSNSFLDRTVALKSVAYIKKLDKNMEKEIYVKKQIIDSTEIKSTNKRLYTFTASNLQDEETLQTPIRIMPIKLFVNSENKVSMATSVFSLEIQSDFYSNVHPTGGYSYSSYSKSYYLYLGNIIIFNTVVSDSNLKSLNIAKKMFRENPPSYENNRTNAPMNYGHYGFYYYPLSSIDFNMINDNIIIVGNSGNNSLYFVGRVSRHQLPYTSEKTTPFIMIIDSKGVLHKGLEFYLKPSDHINVKTSFIDEIYGFDYTLHNNSLYYRNYNSKPNLTRIRFR